MLISPRNVKLNNMGTFIPSTSEYKFMYVYCINCECDLVKNSTTVYIVETLVYGLKVPILFIFTFLGLINMVRGF